MKTARDHTANVLVHQAARLGMSMEDVARITGYPESDLRDWTAGRQPVPRAVLRTLARWRLNRWLARRLQLADERALRPL